MTTAAPLADLALQRILTHADRCVMCGLCSTHCPTYRVVANENESPRGRVSLIQAFARGQLPASPKMLAHVDNCLGCRSCESVCPSGVEFGTLMDLARTTLAPQHAPPSRWLGGLYGSRKIGNAARRLFYVYQRSGLQNLARRSGALAFLRLQRLETLLPDSISNGSLRGYYPARGRERGQVFLFTGCVGNVLDRVTLIAACELLTAVGFAVRVPPQQACCGALPMHTGDSVTATQLTRDNAVAFEGKDPILYVATGCGASLSEYGKTETLPADAAVKSLGQRAQEICSFLVKSGALTPDLFAPFPKRALLHTPCSMRNVIRQGECVVELLNLVPELQLTKLGVAPGCCGAGGVHLIQDSLTSRTLRKETVDTVVRAHPSVLLTTNIGCALNLHSELIERGTAIPVLHPIVLLRQQLRAMPH